MTSLVIQALKTLGRSNVTPAVIQMLSEKLTDKDKQACLKEATESTDWVYDMIRQICGGKKGTMRNIARLSDNDRRELFRNTADKMGLNDAIVEKDFGYVLRWIIYFTAHHGKSPLPFKGMHQLSKAFHLISRFSEDIDLILTGVLGYGKDEPWEKRSNTKQDAFNKEANARAEVFLAETFCPAVRSGLSQKIGCEANVYIDEKDKQTVIFAYPHFFYKYGDLTGDPFRDWCAGSVDSCKNGAD